MNTVDFTNFAFLSHYKINYFLKKLIKDVDVLRLL